MCRELRLANRLAARLNALICTAQSDVVLPAIPPKVRGKALRLSDAVVRQRQLAFKEYIEAAVAAVVAAQRAKLKVLEPPPPPAAGFKMRRPNAKKTEVADIAAASAVLQRFLAE